MKQLNTFKDVAAALREAEGMRERGEVQKVVLSYRSPDIEPVGVCACGGVALVSGFDTSLPWHDDTLPAAFPIMEREVVDPSDHTTDTLQNVMSWLNLSWTWPEIADWLETLPEREN